MLRIKISRLEKEIKILHEKSIVNVGESTVTNGLTKEILEIKGFISFHVGSFPN